MIDAPVSEVAVSPTEGEHVIDGGSATTGGGGGGGGGVTGVGAVGELHAAATKSSATRQRLSTRPPTCTGRLHELSSGIDSR
jgi:hypothetical protein